MDIPIWVHILDESDWISYRANILGEGKNTIILPSPMRLKIELESHPICVEELRF